MRSTRPNGQLKIANKQPLLLLDLRLRFAFFLAARRLGAVFPEAAFLRPVLDAGDRLRLDRMPDVDFFAAMVYGALRPGRYIVPGAGHLYRLSSPGQP